MEGTRTEAYPKAFRSHAWGWKVESHVVRSPVVQAFCAFRGAARWQVDKR
jgi:hypothetical protein